jgi:transcriptional regulator with GAF, ATPase, and Fis domain
MGRIKVIFSSIPQPTAAKMDKLEQTDCSENDYFHLSQVNENDQAAGLLRLLVSTSMACDLPALFNAVITELKDMVDFAAADLYQMNSTAASGDSHWMYRHGRVSCEKDENVSFDPTWGQQPTHPKQFHRSHWVNRLPPESRLFKKETEFEYSYYIPFWHHLTSVGVLVFRTNRRGGFGLRITAVLHISAKILTPKFQSLTLPTNACQQHKTSQTPRTDKDLPSFTCGKMIGASETMRNLFAQVTEVAQATCSVLILGETGTGKELIAKALHEESSRRNKPLVRVNCAALPPDIIESELFGHEKGSFTGAVDRRIGKFEQANNGTIFLDEVGELPLELQTKLLRVLQEREIERVGGRELIKVNVRIIAATNRDLLQEVKKGNFRSDLYFRLNVFPIIVPHLRDRKEDIPVLAIHFLNKHIADRTRRPAGFSSNVMKQLQAYDWPGNVRELENIIQRCSLQANGEIIKELPMQLSRPGHVIAGEARIKTIDEVEREHIISVLKKCKGKVSGVGGAAQALKIPSTTLNSKMRRLDIKFGYMNKE